MADQPALHPTDQTLHAYGLGKLQDSSAEAVGKHLESCPACRSRVAEVSSDSFLGRLRNAQGRPESPAPVVSSMTGPPAQAGARRAPAPSATGTLPPGLAEHPDYEILRELGRGGMGVVYLAQNKLMGRHEVLKVVSGRMVNRSGVLDRFLVEIRNAARLHHPNIVTAYSALRVGEDLVLTMEYVEGFDLSRLVKAKGPLPIANACNYVYQTALGLQHAHEHGMVHRDIKPGNLMMARLGTRSVVKVLDFGLAKVQREQSPAATLTQPGQLLGTPAYMAPEQTSDPRQADIRADIYSLGCTFYYLLTGSPPFQGPNLYDMLQAHQSMEAPPLNLARPDVPVQLAVIVATMMAKEPERRFQTPAGVAQALAPFLKKENHASQASMPVLSQADAAGHPRRSPGTGSVGNQPAATVPTAYPPPPERSAEAAPPGSGWDTLIEIKREEDLSEEVRTLREAERSRAWLWPAAACVVVLLGLAVALGMKLEASKNKANVDRPAVPTASREKVDAPKPAAKTIQPPVVADDRPSPSTTKPQPPSEPPTPPATMSIAQNGGPKGPAPGDEDRSEESSPSKAVQPEETKTDPIPIVADMKAKRDAGPAPEDGSPEAVLAKHGLTKKAESKRVCYIVATEKQFAEMFNTRVRPAMNLLEVAGTILGTALWVQQYVHDLDILITNTQFDIGALNSQIASLPNNPQGRAARQELQQLLLGRQNDLGIAQREYVLARKELVSPAKMQEFKDEFKNRTADFKTAATELLPPYEKLLKEYNDLDGDPKVKGALKILGGRSKVQITLGPSDAIKRAVRQVRELQAAVTTNPDAFLVKRKKTRLRESPKTKARKEG